MNPTVTLESAAQALGRAVTSEASGFESIAGPAPDPELQRFLADLQRCHGVLAARSASGSRVFDSIDDRSVSLLQSFLAREGTTLGADLRPTADGFEAKFDKLDPGWIWSLRTWVKKLRKHQFLPADAAAQVIPGDYRIAVLSDWATGLYGAPVCAQSIQASRDRIDMVLHLGDVYYAGDAGEVAQRFLAHWPDHPGATSRALNGNHEMYSGGNAYFEQILGAPGIRQAASYFAVHNEHWLIAGLDTAYAEHDLHGEQAAWLEQLAAAFPSHGIILFSHHQPFSYFESQGPKLIQKLQKLLLGGRVAAWYWGHEHSCLRYDLHPVWKMFGRCVGHSGFPYFRPGVAGDRPNRTRWLRLDTKGYIPGGLLLDGPNPYVTEQPGAYGPNGYLVLELRGKRVHETYCDPTGQVLDEFEFEAAP